MKKNILLLFVLPCLLLSLVGCCKSASSAAYPANYRAMPQKKMSSSQSYNRGAQNQQKQIFVSQPYRVPTFRQVIINGPFQVELVQGEPGIRLIGYLNDVANCRVSMRAGVLNVEVAKNARLAYMVRIRLSARNMRFISLNGQAQLTAANYNVTHMQIKAAGSSNVRISGKIGVDVLIQEGRGRISLGWIDSRQLCVTSSNGGLVYLYGATKNLIAKLTDSAYLDARYLRAKHATILATDKSSADVVATRDLNIYADKTSNVYYHNTPKEINIVTKNAGNALSMSDMR
jgi:hypothetical protein